MYFSLPKTYSTKLILKYFLQRLFVFLTKKKLLTVKYWQNLPTSVLATVQASHYLPLTIIIFVIKNFCSSEKKPIQLYHQHWGTPFHLSIFSCLKGTLCQLENCKNNILITTDKAFIHEQATCRSNTGKHLQMSTPTWMHFADAIRPNIFINSQNKNTHSDVEFKASHNASWFENESSFHYLFQLCTAWGSRHLSLSLFFFYYIQSFLKTTLSQQYFINVNTAQSSPWLTFN